MNNQNVPVATGSGGDDQLQSKGKGEKSVHMTRQAYSPDLNSTNNFIRCPR